MQVPYQKMHGTGNVILVVDQRAGNVPPPAATTIRRLGNAATGPGFDQVMWLLAASDADHSVRYRVFNADGSEAGQCGNGVRCVAKYLSDEKPQTTRFLLQGPAGSIEARTLDGGLIAVSMGAPIFTLADIPFSASELAVQYKLEVSGKQLDVSALSMGNPHCVLEVDDVQSAAVDDLGPLIEHHARFPGRANVGFMRIRDRRHIDLRVYERGVGETLGCGSGACAAVVAGIARGVLDNDVRVQLPGGEVMVSWRGGHDPVWLTGNAEVASNGMIDLQD